MDTPQRLVLIDDNANDLAVTRRFLERRGYSVATARSGEEGLRLIAENPPDAIVVDYRMPVIDGFEVARRLKRDPQLQTIPVLMLTGADSAEFVVQGLGAGADDYVTKGSDLEVLLARISVLLRVKKYQDDLRRMNDQMRRDLDIARRVQEALVPSGTFLAPQAEIRAAYMPSAVLSGDFYDYFSIDSSMYLFVADVSGHGLPAAILVALLKSYIHTEVDPERSLAEFMSRLNDFLFSVSLPTQFATAQLFRMNGNHELVYANAAHPAFLLHRRDTHQTLTYEQPSNLLGAMPGMDFEEHRVSVSPGDTLFVYTDGLTDRRNAAGDFYSLDRIVSLLDRMEDDDVGRVYESIREDVSAFSATDEFRDDIAFVVSRFR